MLLGITGAISRSAVAPQDLVAEVAAAKDLIHYQLQVMAGGGVDVQVNAAGVLEDAMHLH